jgi:DNA processing protein
VFAVPGSIDMQSFKGSNALLRDGAELVTCGWDIVSRHEWRFPGKIHERKSRRRILTPERSAEPAPQSSEARALAPAPSAELPVSSEPKRQVRLPEGLGEHEIAALNAISGRSTADTVTARTALRPEQVMVALTLLELKGLIKNVGNMTYETVDG